MDTEKRSYYVSVQANTVTESREAASYEFEIEATAEEASELLRWMNQKDNLEADNWIRAQLPGIPYHQDAENDRQDRHLLHTYQLIAKFGTSETKSHLARMGIQ